MNDPNLGSLMKAAAERQLAVAALQKKYAESESIPTEQLVLDMRELLATERVVLDAIITLYPQVGLRHPRVSGRRRGAGREIPGCRLGLLAGGVTLLAAAPTKPGEPCAASGRRGDYPSERRTSSDGERSRTKTCVCAGQRGGEPGSRFGGFDVLERN